MGQEIKFSLRIQRAQQKLSSYRAKNARVRFSIHPLQRLENNIDAANRNEAVGTTLEEMQLMSSEEKGLVLIQVHTTWLSLQQTVWPEH